MKKTVRKKSSTKPNEAVTKIPSVIEPAEKIEPPVQTVNNADVPDIPIDAPLKVESEVEVNEEPLIERHNKKLLGLGIFILILVIASCGLFGYYFLNQSEPKKTIEPEEEETIEVEVTPAPVTLNKDTWTFEVLNGTATAGVAKNVAEKLQVLGYKVVLTGNADRKDYEKNQISISAQKNAEEIKLMLEDIKSAVDILDSSSDLKDSTASARIIIGNK